VAPLAPTGGPPADQLSLELEPSMPGLPAVLRPMVARHHPVPFDSADHLFEPSWGGRRALAFIEPAVAPAPDGLGPPGGFVTADGRPSLRLLDPGLRDWAARLPELVDLPARIDARSAVVDGELVVVTASGRPDPAALEERLAGREGPPVAYLVFDVLYLDGRPLLSEPLHRRRATLRRVLAPGESVVAVPAIPGEGLALHDAASGQGLAGVLARVRTSPYLPGVRSRLWRSIPAGPGASPALPEDGPAPSSPVLALIARLPLPFPDDD
jgi:bifunctional non-homologous end joining protein LigD